MWHWHHWGNGEWAAGDWLSMLFMMALVWIPILILGLLFLRGAFGAPGRDDRGGAGSAEEEARRSYARGEIDRERFIQTMQDLRDHRSARG